MCPGKREATPKQGQEPGPAWKEGIDKLKKDIKGHQKEIQQKVAQGTALKMNKDKNIFRKGAVTSGLDKIAGFVSCDVYDSPMESLASQISHLPQSHRMELLTLSKHLSTNIGFLKEERNRVSLAKLLTCFLPDSLPILRNVLGRRKGALNYELQFSIFCYLDEFPVVGKVKELRETLVLLVERYLLGVTSETGLAAWMAGDLLGGHWEEKAALRVLSQVARRAYHPAGRLGTLHGLEQLNDRVKADRSSIQSIQNTLDGVLRRDRSSRVRRVAQIVLESIAAQPGKSRVQS